MAFLFFAAILQFGEWQCDPYTPRRQRLMMLGWAGFCLACAVAAKFL